MKFDYGMNSCTNNYSFVLRFKLKYRSRVTFQNLKNHNTTVHSVCYYILDLQGVASDKELQGVKSSLDYKMKRCKIHLRIDTA